MNIRKQKIFKYLLIIGLSILAALISYSIHKNDDFYFFSKDKKENNSLSENNTIIDAVAKNKILSYEESKFFNDNNLAVFIDARSSDEINQNKVNSNYMMIPDAKWISVEDIDFLNDEGYIEDPKLLNDIDLNYFNDQYQTFLQLQEYPKNLIYVVYCGSSSCDKSENLYQYMIEDFGFTNVYIYKGGWEEWLKFND